MKIRIQRIEHYSTEEIEVPDGTTADQVMEMIEKGDFEHQLDAADYEDCTYDVITEEGA